MKCTSCNSSGGNIPYLFLILLMLLLPVQAWALNVDELFAQGISASKEGEYQSALTAFKLASENGLDSAALNYNLGVAYYRLAKYTEAYGSFLALVNHPNLSALASYNLGLTSTKLNNIEEAKQWFTRSFQDAGNENLRILSQRALLAFDATTVKIDTPEVKINIDERKWHGLLSVDILYDNNINLAYEEINPIVSSTVIEDNYSEIMLSTGIYAYGDKYAGLKFSADFNRSNYLKHTGNNFKSYKVTLAKDQQILGWLTRLALSRDETTYGNDGFNYDDLELKADRRIGDAVKFKLRFRRTKITPENPSFYYIDGFRNQFRTDLQWQKDKYAIKLTHIFEENHRKDYELPNDKFVSYSPIRNSLKLSTEAKLSQRTKLSASIQYRISRYNRDDNVEKVTPTDLNFVTYQRQDERYRYGLALDYRVTKRLHLIFGGDRTTNESNRVRFLKSSVSNYQRNVIYLEVRWFY